MTRKQRRIWMLAGGAIVLSAAAALVLTALNDTIVFFHSPTDIVEKHISVGQRIRLGGLVEDGSVQRGTGLEIQFNVTDLSKSIPVIYKGVLPDLFREGQGVIAEGKLVAGGSFSADTILAKHDENYMPAEVADSLKKAGVWQGDKTK
ncbi:MAG: cytochrome c maturation protein CcmE [Alphaproteobacteria bacterium]